MMNRLKLETPSGGVAIAATETDILWAGASSSFATIKLEPKRIACLTFRLTAATANVTSVKVYGKVSEEDTVWLPLATASADYTTGASRWVWNSRVHSSVGAFVDKDLTTIDAGQIGILTIVTPGLALVKLTAVGNGATITGVVMGVDAPVAAGTEGTLEAILAAVRPSLSLFGGSKTAGAGWDADTGEIDLTVGGTITPQFIDVGFTKGVYLVANTSTSDPASNPAAYFVGSTTADGNTVRLPCFGQTKLHYKNATGDNATVSVTVYGAAV